MSKDLRKILENKDLKAGKASNLLDKLLRNIFFEHQITPYRWSQLVNKLYQSEIFKGKTSKFISSDRNNFNRAIAHGGISWKTFIRAIKLLCAVKVEFVCRLHWHNGVTEHTVATYVETPPTEVNDDKS